MRLGKWGREMATWAYTVFCLAADMPDQNFRKDGVDMGTLIICKTRASTLFIYLFVFF